MSLDKLGDPLVLVLIGVVLVLLAVLYLLLRRKSNVHVQQATGGSRVHHDAHTATTIHIGQLHVQSLHVRRDE